MFGNRVENAFFCSFKICLYLNNCLDFDNMFFYIKAIYMFLYKNVIYILRAPNMLVYLQWYFIWVDLYFISKYTAKFATPRKSTLTNHI